MIWFFLTIFRWILCRGTHTFYHFAIDFGFILHLKMYKCCLLFSSHCGVSCEVIVQTIQYRPKSNLINKRLTTMPVIFAFFLIFPVQLLQWVTAPIYDVIFWQICETVHMICQSVENSYVHITGHPRACEVILRCEDGNQ
jgi:hypothetical protein